MDVAPAERDVERHFGALCLGVYARPSADATDVPAADAALMAGAPRGPRNRP